MDYLITTSDDQHYIIIELKSDFTGKEMLQCIVESHSLGQRLGIHRYLVESRCARNLDNALDNYKFAHSDMKTTPEVDPLARVAIIACPDDHSHDFISTTSKNAGMNLEVFTEPSKAREFLLEDLN